MKLVVGLGNPGVEYINTWHNTGFFAVDLLNSYKLSNVKLFKSTEFMNDSGSFVSDVVEKYKISLSDLYIIHDDLDLVLGTFKIQFGRGPKDHGGLNSINKMLMTDKYWHVRIGVDNRTADNRIPGIDFVLQNYSDGEKQILGNTIKSACKKLATLLTNTN
jgi:peptidyl-tRNA hydrolase, PTH1 family